MTSSLRVLGCSGGIGKDLRTTTFLLNSTILIDAGTGVGDLSLDELKKIDYLFLTHSHLDHICSLPFILDAVGIHREKPLLVLGIEATIHALKAHIFNNTIWPDFSKIPSKEKPCLAYEVIDIGQTITVGEVEITALPVNHSIPANGYWIDSGNGALVFSGDTGPSIAFLNAINAKVNEKETERERDKGNNYLKHLIIETSFTNAEHELAKLSGHYHPHSLATDLENLKSNCPIWITHLKPEESIQILQEITHLLDGKRNAKALQNGQLLTF